MNELLKLVGIQHTGLQEKYGPVRLYPEVYPINATLNNGGCSAGGSDDGYCAQPQPASAGELADAACAARRSQIRGGNNPNVFRECAQSKVVGTGCMNPACHCPNCQGDCVCGRRVEHFGGEATKSWLFWIAVIVAAYVIYCYLGGKPLGKVLKGKK